MADVFTPELTFGPWSSGIMTPTAPGAPYRTIQGGLAAWTPANITTILWYDVSDLNSMFQDAAGTVPAVVGQPVGRINDKSGNGRHRTQATSSAKPTLRQNGSKYRLEYDGVDDGLAYNLGVPGLFPDAVDIFAAIQPIADPAWVTVFAPSSFSANWAGAAASGSASATPSTAMTSVELVNGVAIVPQDQNHLYLAITTNPSVYESQGATGWAAWDSFAMGNYSSFEFGGYEYSSLAAAPLSAANRANVRAYMTALMV